MRALRLGLLSFLVFAAAACTQPPTAPPLPSATPPPPTAAMPLPSAVPPTLSPTLAPTVTPSPQPSPTFTVAPTARPQPALEGPLSANGQPIRMVDLGPGATRYGALAGGLARSDDTGRAWHRVSDLALPLPFVSSDNGRLLFAGNVPSCYRDGENPRFYRSSDGGATWQEIPAGRGIKPVAVNPGTSRLLYGISCSGLHTSRDAGQTWQLSGPTRGWDITAIIPTGPDRYRLLAVLTSEGGTSHLAWFNEEGKLEQDMTQGFSFWGKGALAHSAQNYYLADSTGVWRSTDASQWTQFNAGLADVVLPVDPLRDPIPQATMQRGFGLLALAPDPANPQRLALGTVRGLYISDDGGEHWRPAGIAQLAQRRIDQVLWEPAEPGTLYAATPDGVYRVRLGG